MSIPLANSVREARDGVVQEGLTQCGISLRKVPLLHHLIEYAPWTSLFFFLQFRTGGVTTTILKFRLSKQGKVDELVKKNCRLNSFFVRTYGPEKKMEMAFFTFSLYHWMNTVYI